MNERAYRVAFGAALLGIAGCLDPSVTTDGGTHDSGPTADVNGGSDVVDSGVAMDTGTDDTGPTDDVQAMDTPPPMDVAHDVAHDVARDVAQDVPRDVPAGDGSVLGGPSRCAGMGYLICEDFEGGNYDTTTWHPHTTSGTMVIDAMHVARGSGALHIHTTTVAGTTNGANVGLTANRTFTNNTYFGRAFVWLATASPTTHTTLFESGGAFTATTGIFPAGNHVSLRYSISNHQLDASLDNSPHPPTSDYAHRSATAMPLNRWACLEWEFKGPNNEIHYWLDGNELTDMRVLGTDTPVWSIPPMDHVTVGLQLYRPDTINDFDMWIDEVAIHSARIGCGG